MDLGIIKDHQALHLMGVTDYLVNLLCSNLLQLFIYYIHFCYVLVEVKIVLNGHVWYNQIYHT